MENNILTAKEWLEDKAKLDGVCKNNPHFKGLDSLISEVMEDYASYKNKVLEDKILEFREDIKSIGITMEGCFIIKHSNGNSTAYNILNAYDRSFNITTE